MTLILSRQTANLISEAFAAIQENTAAVVAHDRMGLAEDYRDAFFTDGGDELEWVTEYRAAHGGKFPSVHDAILRDLSNIMETVKYYEGKVKEMVDHKCVYPPLEEVGDGARICSICGSNGDV